MRSPPNSAMDSCVPGMEMDASEVASGTLSIQSGLLAVESVRYEASARRTSSRGSGSARMDGARSSTSVKGRVSIVGYGERAGR